jgi:hypothetical protein
MGLTKHYIDYLIAVGLMEYDTTERAQEYAYYCAQKAETKRPDWRAQLINNTYKFKNNERNN